MSLPSREVLLEEVSYFVDDFELILTPDEIRPGLAVPEGWRGVLGQPEALAGLWRTMEPELPNVLDILRTKIQGTALLVEPGDRVSLLYVYTADDEVFIYKGRAPLGARVPAHLARVWDSLPPKLRVFYFAVHDGWTDLMANAAGPLPTGDFSFLSDPSWDLDAHGGPPLFDPDKTFSVFSNGGGDYLCLDAGRPAAGGHASALIWWKETPGEPELNVDFWPVMDVWIREASFRNAD